MKSRRVSLRAHPTTRIAVLAAALLVALTAATWTSAQQRGRCAVAELPGVLVLPDGSVHRATMLKICFEEWHNPSTGRHVIYLDGRKWGYLLSRAGTSHGGGPDVPVFVFTTRDEGERVRLLGYGWPEREGTAVHALHRPGARLPRRGPDPADLLAPERDADYVRVTARVDRAARR